MARRSTLPVRHPASRDVPLHTRNSILRKKSNQSAWGRGCWGPVKRRLHEMFGIQMNFSESHENYYSAYKYVCKNDPDVYKSVNHPDLQELGSSTTKKCMSAYRQKCGKRKLDKNREITVSHINGLNTINGSQLQNASQSKVR